MFTKQINLPYTLDAFRLPSFKEHFGQEFEPITSYDVPTPSALRARRMSGPALLCHLPGNTAFDATSATDHCRRRSSLASLVGHPYWRVDSTTASSSSSLASPQHSPTKLPDMLHPPFDSMSHPLPIPTTTTTTMHLPNAHHVTRSQSLPYPTALPSPVGMTDTHYAVTAQETSCSPPTHRFTSLPQPPTFPSTSPSMLPSVSHPTGKSVTHSAPRSADLLPSTDWGVFPPRGWTGARRGSAPALCMSQRMRLSSLLETCDETPGLSMQTMDEHTGDEMSDLPALTPPRVPSLTNTHCTPASSWSSSSSSSASSICSIVGSPMASRLPSIRNLLNDGAIEESETTTPSYYPPSSSSSSSSLTSTSVYTTNLPYTRPLSRHASSPMLSYGNTDAPPPDMTRRKSTNTLLPLTNSKNTPLTPASAPGGISPSSAHVCPLCHRRFNRAEHVRRHQRVHTQERPYECSWAGCSRRFARRDNLAQHERTHERRAERRRQKALMRQEQQTNHLSSSSSRRSSLSTDTLGYADLPQSFGTFTLSDASERDTASKLAV
jgi:hypothetical protein